MVTNRQRAINKEVSLLFPAIPYADSVLIKGAVLSPHMKSLPPSIAVWLAAIAHIRHQYTEYDSLRNDGYDKDSARFFVLDTINEKLSQWRATRLLSAEEDV